MTKKENWFMNIRFRRIVQVSLVLVVAVSMVLLITEEKREEKKEINRLENVSGASTEEVVGFIDSSKDLKLASDERKGIVEYRLLYDRTNEKEVISELDKLEFILLISKEEDMIAKEKAYIEELVLDYDYEFLSANITKIVEREYPENLSSYKKNIISNYNGLLEIASKYESTLGKEAISEAEWKSSQEALEKHLSELKKLYNEYETVEGEFIFGEEIFISEDIIKE